MCVLEVFVQTFIQSFDRFETRIFEDSTTIKKLMKASFTKSWRDVVQSTFPGMRGVFFGVVKSKAESAGIKQAIRAKDLTRVTQGAPSVGTSV